MPVFIGEGAFASRRITAIAIQTRPAAGSLQSSIRKDDANSHTGHGKTEDQCGEDKNLHRGGCSLGNSSLVLDPRKAIAESGDMLRIEVTGSLYGPLSRRAIHVSQFAHVL